MPLPKLTISKPNDLSFKTLGPALICLLAGVYVAINNVWASIPLFVACVAIVSHGTKTSIDFNANTIVRNLTVLYIPLGFNKQIYKKDDFDTVSLSQFSDFDGAQFRSHSSSVKIREYHVILSSSASGNKFSIAVYGDYYAARELLLKLKEHWQYAANDTIQKKMASNKSGNRR